MAAGNGDRNMLLQLLPAPGPDWRVMMVASHHLAGTVGTHGHFLLVQISERWLLVWNVVLLCQKERKYSMLYVNYFFLLYAMYFV